MLPLWARCGQTAPPTGLTSLWRSADSEPRAVEVIAGVLLALFDLSGADALERGERAARGEGVIQTWIIGTGVNFSPILQLPSLSVTLITRACPSTSGVKHKLSWMCHCMSAPPISGTVSSVDPVGNMNIAETSVRSSPRTSYTSDSGKSGSRTLPSSMRSQLM